MRHYIFADESGCLTFKKGHNISKYFILCTITSQNCDIGTELLKLRRDLLWEGYSLGDYFHATKDIQLVRDQVFNLIQAHNFRVDATIYEKSKAQSQLTATKNRFYKYAWYFHLKHLAPILVEHDDELVLTAASIGTAKERATLKEAINDVVQQCFHNSIEWKTAFWPAASDPCLIIADYCAWAIQRKWERGDERSYDLIKNKIKTEYNIWRNSTKYYY